MEGAAYRNTLEKGLARKVDKIYKMKKMKNTNGRQLQLEDKTINQSALAVVTKANIQN